jgi:pimeloyl-ACP methyl ester carboxylesterase
VKLAFRDSGTSGVSVVLIHGITEDHRAWDDFVPELSRHARVVRVDLPGHGRSAPLERYSAPAIVTPVVELVTDLGLDRPHVIGHSLGGLIATLLGALVPVRSILNLDQSLRLGPFIERIRAIARRLEGPDFVAALNLEMDALGGPALPDRVMQELRSYRTEARRPVVHDLWLPLVNETEESLTATLAPFLEQVRAPYLSLHGSDPGPGYEAWLQRLIPSAHVEVWPGQGHWLHRVDPARFLARVREFHARSADSSPT